MTFSGRWTLMMAVILIWVLASGTGDAHRMVLGYRVNELQLSALYDDGTPAQGIRIVAMKDGEVVSEGTTDTEGSLLFRPDGDLRGYSFVSSSAGHRAELDLGGQDEESADQMPILLRVGAGLGYLMGLAGLSMLYISKRKANNKGSVD